jgi:Xaa-Pro aminopeptidase
MTVAAASQNREEQRSRLAGVIDKHDLRAVVASSYQAVSYLAGTYIMTQVSLPDRLEFCVVFDDGSASMLVCNLETSMVRAQTDIADVHEYTEFIDDPAEALGGFLVSRGITSGNVGIEARRLHADGYQRLQAALPGVTLVAVDEEIEELQSVKTEIEIRALRRAAQTTLHALLGAVAEAKAGDNERTFCADITARLQRQGGVFGFMVFGTGARALGAHVEAIDKPLADGELWRIDLGARFGGAINSDLARTGIIGDASARQEEILASLRATQDAGFAAIEPGRPASDVFHAVKAAFEREKLPFFMPHIGHGLGIGLHEFPLLQPTNEARLEVGMVLNIEPMVVFPNEGECYHTEDLVLVTEDGCELLTEPQKHLLQIEG